jgi:hypothetical protein
MSKQEYPSSNGFKANRQETTPKQTGVTLKALIIPQGKEKFVPVLYFN